MEAEAANTTQNDVVLQSDNSDGELPVEDEFLAESIDDEKPFTSSQALTKNMLQLLTVASVCDKTGFLDRVEVAIASSVLKDVGMISEKNKTNVIDRMKIRRARARNRQTT